MKFARILAKAGEELLRKRRRATEGVRGHAVLVWLPQPKGAGGLQLAVMLAQASIPCWARQARTEAVTAKNCGIGKRNRRRELLDPLSETGDKRRCRVAPQAR